MQHYNLKHAYISKSTISFKQIPALSYVISHTEVLYIITHTHTHPPTHMYLTHHSFLIEINYNYLQACTCTKKPKCFLFPFDRFFKSSTLVVSLSAMNLRSLNTIASIGICVFNFALKRAIHSGTALEDSTCRNNDELPFITLCSLFPRLSKKRTSKIC